MNYNESINNINQVGKKSIVIRFNKLVSDFFSMVLEQKLLDFEESSKLGRQAEVIFDVAMIIDGQCCEGDYVVTTNENEDHDFDSLKEVVQWHEWAAGPTDRELRHAWKVLKPFTIKEEVTWG